ncbi:hypothetical protein SteCoe_21183 [Stentor coeruleus]|uniref:Uncharacterized protein n=1 Tax=Stentor coeruleus TaxID=5963 RepID=A0A1R2BQ26_9CILI|nr:hypothetical protein SteCoe_21183 [Stentor coeruleus]
MKKLRKTYSSSGKYTTKEIPGWRPQSEDLRPNFVVESKLPALLQSRSDYNKNLVYPHWNLKTERSNSPIILKKSKKYQLLTSVKPRQEELKFEKKKEYEKIIGKNILIGSMMTKETIPTLEQSQIPSKSTSLPTSRQENPPKFIQNKPTKGLSHKNIDIGIDKKSFPNRNIISYTDRPGMISQGLQVAESLKNEVATNAMSTPPSGLVSVFNSNKKKGQNNRSSKENLTSGAVSMRCSSENSLSDRILENRLSKIPHPGHKKISVPSLDLSAAVAQLKCLDKIPIGSSECSFITKTDKDIHRKYENSSAQESEKIDDYCFSISRADKEFGEKSTNMTYSKSQKHKSMDSDIIITPPNIGIRKIHNFSVPNSKDKSYRKMATSKVYKESESLPSSKPLSKNVSQGASPLISPKIVEKQIIKEYEKNHIYQKKNNELNDKKMRTQISLKDLSKFQESDDPKFSTPIRSKSDIKLADIVRLKNKDYEDSKVIAYDEIPNFNEIVKKNEIKGAKKENNKKREKIKKAVSRDSVFTSKDSVLTSKESKEFMRKFTMNSEIGDKDQEDEVNNDEKKKKFLKRKSNKNAVSRKSIVVKKVVEEDFQTLKMTKEEIAEKKMEEYKEQAIIVHNRNSSLDIIPERNRDKNRRNAVKHTKQASEHDSIISKQQSNLTNESIPKDPEDNISSDEDQSKELDSARHSQHDIKHTDSSHKPKKRDISDSQKRQSTMSFKVTVNNKEIPLGKDIESPEPPPKLNKKWSSAEFTSKLSPLQKNEDIEIQDKNISRISILRKINQPKMLSTKYKSPRKKSSMSNTPISVSKNQSEESENSDEDEENTNSLSPHMPNRKNNSVLYELNHLEMIKKMMQSMKKKDDKTDISGIAAKLAENGGNQGGKLLEDSDIGSDSYEDVDITKELADLMRSKNFSLNKFAFSSQIAFRFAQKCDMNPNVDVNDIEINEYNMDYDAFDCYLQKKRFMNNGNFNILDYKPVGGRNLEQLDPEELLPIDVHRKRIKAFEKIRKRERIIATRGDVVRIGGKPILTFSGIPVRILKNHELKKTINDKEIIKSGGSCNVRDDQHLSERVYCRIKNEDNLEALSQQKPSIANNLNSLSNNFKLFEQVYNK